MELPDWWNWELELTPHLLKRMVDRGFNEADVRAMLDDVVNIVPQGNERFRVEAALEGKSWIVILEPDPGDEAILVITAYPNQ